MQPEKVYGFAVFKAEGEQEARANQIIEDGISIDQIQKWTGVKKSVIESIIYSKLQTEEEDGPSVLVSLIQTIDGLVNNGDKEDNNNSSTLSLLFEKENSNNSLQTIEENRGLLDALVKAIRKRVEEICYLHHLTCEPGRGTERWAWWLLKESKWKRKETDRLRTKVWSWGGEFATINSRPMNGTTIEVYDSRIRKSDEILTTATVTSLDCSSSDLRSQQQAAAAAVVEEPMPKLQYLHGITGNEAKSLACLFSIYFDRRDVSTTLRFYRSLMMFNRSYRHEILSSFDKNRFSSVSPKMSIESVDQAMRVTTNDFCFARNLNLRNAPSAASAHLTPKAYQLREYSSFFQDFACVNGSALNETSTMCVWHLMFKLAFRGIVPTVVLDRVAAGSPLNAFSCCTLPLESYTAFVVAFGNTDLVHMVTKVLEAQQQCSHSSSGARTSLGLTRGCPMNPFIRLGGGGNNTPSTSTPAGTQQQQNWNWSDDDELLRFDSVLETVSPPIHLRREAHQKRYTYQPEPGTAGRFAQEENRSLMSFTQIQLNGFYRGLVFLLCKCPTMVSFLHLAVFSACPRVIDVLLKNSQYFVSQAVSEDENEDESSNSNSLTSTSLSAFVNKPMPFCWNPPVDINNSHDESAMDILLYQLVDGVHPHLEGYICRQLIEAQAKAALVTAAEANYGSGCYQKEEVNKAVLKQIVLGVDDEKSTKSQAKNSEPFAYLNKTIANLKLHLTKTLLNLGFRLNILEDMLTVPDTNSPFSTLNLSPLQLALTLRDEEYSLKIVRLLVSFGADINLVLPVGPERDSPGLDTACVAGKSLKYIKVLVEELGASFGHGFREESKSSSSSSTCPVGDDSSAAVPQTSSLKTDDQDQGERATETLVDKTGKKREKEYLPSIHPIFSTYHMPDVFQYLAERDPAHFVEARNFSSMSVLQTFSLLRTRMMGDETPLKYKRGFLETFRFCMSHTGFSPESKFFAVINICAQGIVPFVEVLLLPENEKEGKAEEVGSDGLWTSRSSTTTTTSGPSSEKKAKNWGGYTFNLKETASQMKGINILSVVNDAETLQLILQSPVHGQECRDLIRDPSHPIFKGGQRPLLTHRTSLEMADLLLRNGYPVDHPSPIQKGNSRLSISVLAACVAFKDRENKTGLAELLISYGANLDVTIKKVKKKLPDASHPDDHDAGNDDEKDDTTTTATKEEENGEETAGSERRTILEMNIAKNGGSTAVADKLRKLAEDYVAKKESFDSTKKEGQFQFNFF